MKIDLSESHLPVYEALASDVRLKIIHLLARQDMNIKDLAQALELSSPIMTMHVKKLEKAGLISSEMVSGGAGTKKMCKLVTDRIEIDFPTRSRPAFRAYHESIVSVGHYTDFEIEPTCGLATTSKVIGMFDEPRFFLDPERMNAKILWFGSGYIEYKIANFLLKSEKPAELEISFEISSEAPLANDNWPSDITFYLNDTKIGMWTSPGDFGGKRGKFTPEWWRDDINQYGLLKVLKITPDGTYIDGRRISRVTLDDVGIGNKQLKFRIAVEPDAEHVGGVTLFGAGFGNYNQDIVFKLYYERIE
ncbi:ArsR/SmtB family transcription factor [Paenibacillus arenilitoris]|uniref:ArsR family transcriptional regulator n=1 Tax=Paenibacillus arenilitoris TaxID=2772299 RepID=A0A927CM97_9BACL|nr:ArsR family transcriptional regulator [Paenibacillus arenilitoris]MBD2869183.1 ArsR family transcriptional regulator [Paenibacillus arenilitoris]